MNALRLTCAALTVTCALLAGYVAAGVWVSADPLGFELVEAES